MAPQHISALTDGCSDILTAVSTERSITLVVPCISHSQHRIVKGIQIIFRAWISQEPILVYQAVAILNVCFFKTDIFLNCTHIEFDVCALILDLGCWSLFKWFEHFFAVLGSKLSKPSLLSIQLAYRMLWSIGEGEDHCGLVALFQWSKRLILVAGKRCNYAE